MQLHNKDGELDMLAMDSFLDLFVSLNVDGSQKEYRSMKYVIPRHKNIDHP